MSNKWWLLLPVVLFPACNKDEEIEGAVAPGMRPATADSSPRADRVYEYMPAPGQFIGEFLAADGSPVEIRSAREAAQWAEERLESGKFVSLGAFGGYIVVGFDHSVVPSAGGYDFLVEGNAFESAQGSSNEPGIVWVMQDSNGNGRPDDVWYELKGSESGGARKDYSVTYYRPGGVGEDVRWTDSEGGSGTVDYLATFHGQDSYYPAWIEADSYTLTGTVIPANGRKDESTGSWATPPYAWGYADNCGSDKSGNAVGFKISNAVSAAGKPVALDYIDFIKVQTAVQGKCGHLGEISTEVLGFTDCSM